MIGSAVYVVLLLLGGGGLLALFLTQALRGFVLSLSAVRWLAHGVELVFGARRSVLDPERPLNVDGLTPGLARLAQQTRTLALELRRRSEEARHWPEDASELELVRVRWWSGLVAPAVDIQPVVDTRRDVFDWLDTVAGLSAHERARLGELGIEVEAVRSALTDNRSVADSVRELAGLLWGIDERLAGAVGHGYRSNNAETQPSAAGLRLASLAASAGRDGGAGEDEASESDELDRRRRFAKLIAAEGSGLSRLAASYAKTQAEREDLEQDILLALWQALPRFRGEASIETFAYRVARYCCYRQVRRRAKQLHDASDVEQLVALGDAACLETSLLRADELAALDQARATLPDNLAAPLKLHLSGLSYAEIAERLGISERNVSVRLTRARAKLRRCFMGAGAEVVAS